MVRDKAEIRRLMRRFLLFPLVDCYAYVFRAAKALQGRPTRHRQKHPLAYRAEDNY